MIDIKLIREDPEVLRANIARRGEDTGIVLRAKSLDEEWRAALQEAEALRSERNKATAQISVAKREGKDASDAIASMKSIPGEIKDCEERVESLKTELDALMLEIPNILHESVPSGEGEEGNIILREIGEKKEFSFTPRDHIDLGELCDLIELERAAKVSGARFYYLKNELVELEFALVQYVLSILVKRGFTLFTTPALIKEEVMEGAGYLPTGRDSIYMIEGEKLCLVGTSEQALAGLHMDEILDANKLPLRYCGFSPCFRTEAGSHGRDSKGIFRVHQFDKVEMFIFSDPEKSWEEHDFLIETAEEIWKGLKIPYRVVNICTGDIGNVAAKKYDIEAWLPGQGKYREVVSCSNCTDYQARRLKIRCRADTSEKTEFAHTLNSTACAISRALVAIMENYQEEDGSIVMPEALRPFLRFDKIEAKPKVE